MRERFVVTVSRAVPLGGTDLVLIGPFHSRARADAKAATVRRLAERYEDDEAALDVIVEPLLSGPTSARDAMYALYDTAPTSAPETTDARS